eukprot:gene11795-biopygen5597
MRGPPAAPARRRPLRGRRRGGRPAALVVPRPHAEAAAVAEPRLRLLAARDEVGGERLRGVVALEVRRQPRVVRCVVTMRARYSVPLPAASTRHSPTTCPTARAGGGAGGGGGSAPHSGQSPGYMELPVAVEEVPSQRAAAVPVLTERGPPIVSIFHIVGAGGAAERAASCRGRDACKLPRQHTKYV